MFIKIVDNFLPDEVFQMLRNTVYHNRFKWEYRHDSLENRDMLEDHTQNTNSHMRENMASLVYAHGYHCFEYDSVWNMFLLKHKDTVPFALPIRMKTNLYFNRGKKIPHQAHCDMENINYTDGLEPNVITSVFNFHDCNGSTNIIKPDKTEEVVESKANRIVFFDNGLHYGVGQDDTPIRIVLNTNVWTTVPDGM